MKTLKKIVSINLFSLILFLGAQAQVKNMPKDEPYPAPVSYAELTPEQAAFIALFEDKEVTNLHVYASTNPNPEPEYFYKGRPITPTFSGFFRGRLARNTGVRGSEPHAVFSMRGEAEELYILRIPDSRKGNPVALYRREGDRMKEILELASIRCNNRRCIQVDSWIQDVNGDTRLDVIQKTRKLRGQDEAAAKTKTVVYTMEQDGTFRRNKYAEAEITEADYIMEDIALPEL